MLLDEIAKFFRRLFTLAGCVCFIFTIAFAGAIRGEGSPSGAKTASAVPSADHVTEFTISDGDQCESVHTGKCSLSGTLKINFAGRILPHENTNVVLYGKGVSSISGKFDHVEVPKGWLYDLTYDYKKPEVVIKNFRPDHPPAFPGAEGFGKYAIGGRGGRVIAVTNLNDRGPGSFREAVTAEGPRIVVFRVSGTIPLESKIKIQNPFITIAGQTAPGDGICVRNHQVIFNTHDVVIRYMRFRPGASSGITYDGFGSNGGSEAIVDHCSVSWGVDEVLSINKTANLTVQWCMATESLSDSIHKKGKHGYGGLWGGPGGSWHHNILAHHTSRNPRASGNTQSGLLDYRNNVVYNWGFQSAYGGELWPRNWINNYYKYGPATDPKVQRRIFFQADARGRMYLDGTYVWGFPEITKNNWAGGVDFSPDGDATEATLRVNEPYVVAPVRTQSAEEAFDLVLNHAGASLARDSVDSRIINEIRTGTARFGRSYGGGGKGIIDTPEDVGGWPVLKSKPAPLDTDGDGMPDDWERSQGLNPQSAADGPLDRHGDGYTDVEKYLNSLAPPVYSEPAARASATVQQKSSS
jgi:hypothetical protein